MPDKTHEKFKPKLPELGAPPPAAPPPYAELQVCSNFSFLRGASHPEELISQAVRLGYKAIAITDINTLSGIVRAYNVARQSDILFLVGSRLRITLGLSSELSYLDLLVYPQNREGYGNLCSLLTLGKRRVEKGGCFITLEDFWLYQKGLIPILVPDVKIGEEKNFEAFVEIAQQFKTHLLEQRLLSIAFSKSFRHDGQAAFQATEELSKRVKIPLVVTNDVYHHIPGRKPLQDVLTCIREACTIQQAGALLMQNADRFLKPAAEMYRLFKDYPEALRRTLEIAESAKNFSLAQLKYEYPDEICPDGKDPFTYLCKLTWEGARQRYGDQVPEKIKAILEEEFTLIRELKYEKYFLTCHDIVRFARSKNILCQGRGAAANSAVCYCLEITSVDPDRIDTLFARFVSKERDEPPDIDIDFEHERREEVLQYIYQKYGRERAGLTCEVVSYRHRSAVREVGKALGLNLQTVDALAKSIHRWTDCELSEKDLLELGLNPHDITIQNTITLSKQLYGFPRHLSQHVGGFIISNQPLSQIVPILNASMPDRTIIEWDKDDIEIMGMLKIDCLGLGMLSCIRRALEFINRRRLRTSERELALYSIPAEDPKVYDMVSQADTIGVFQIESRAQMSMLPRLKPRCFYDLVIEVAIVRPGPIQGNMVHPYLKRREGREKPYYPDARVEKILGKTLGVPLFQEQAMRLAIVLAQFSPGEAEQLRRAMAAWKRNKDVIASFQAKIIRGMLRNGYSLEFAENCVEQIKGFSEYGFPESHAASFALLVYASAWIKKYYPAEFAVALLNSQPMGFYAPSQIVQDAQAHGVKILPIDINKSTWDSALEYDERLPATSETIPAIRLGMHLVRSLPEIQAELLVRARNNYGQSASIEALWYKCRLGAGPQAAPLMAPNGSRLRRASLQALARADAFGSMGLSSRQALWEIKALPEETTPLDAALAATSAGSEPCTQIPAQTIQQSMFSDYHATGLSLRAHPVGLMRKALEERSVKTATFLRSLDIKKIPKHFEVKVAGIAIVRQRPGTAKGMVFLTIEDETGMVNLVVDPQVFEQHRKVVITSSVIMAQGTLQRVGPVVYVSVRRIESLDAVISASKNQRETLPSRSYAY